MTQTFRYFMLFCAFVAPLSAAAQDALRGQEIFVDHCAACHGADATGTGPLAELIAIETPDLTGLASRNDGVFPASAAARQIDGRDQLRAHGGAMPLFGAFFESDTAVAVRTETGQPMMVSPPIADLLTWLAQVQR